MAPVLSLATQTSAGPTPTLHTRPKTPTPCTSQSKSWTTIKDKSPYDILYRRPSGYLISEDVCSPARLAAIYAQNASPGQRTYSYTQTCNAGSTTISSNMMPPPSHSPWYNPSQPPRYCRPGVSLQQWAAARAKSDRKHWKTELARQDERTRRVSGLNAALELALEAHARKAVAKADFSEPYLHKHKAESAGSVLERPRIPMPLHAQVHEAPPPDKEALSVEYGQAFESWDAAMKKTIPGYAGDTRKRKWFTSGVERPKQRDVDDSKRKATGVIWLEGIAYIFDGQGRLTMVDQNTLEDSTYEKSHRVQS